MTVIPYRRFWLSLSGVLVGVSLLALLVFGLKAGIDFTGGTLLEVEYPDGRPETAQIQEALASLNLGTISIQPADELTVILRFKPIDDDTRKKLIDSLNQARASGHSEIKEKVFQSVGPVIGQELKRKAFWAILFVLAVIISYIAYAFRKVSWPVQSWKYGVIAIIALFHDVIGTLGLFAILGYFLGIEVNATFVAAILTILGYSVMDTIVIFDRIRENLAKHENLTFSEVIDKSINDTLARSINTTLTTELSLIAVFLFGGESISSFALALIWGIFLGGYSSIFLASPLLVSWYSWDRRQSSA